MTTLRLLDCGPSLRGWSNQEDILVCPYRWGLKHMDESDRPRLPSDPLIKGSLVHAGLAHFWSQRIGIPGLLAPVDAIAKLASDEDFKIAAAIGYSDLWRTHVDLATKTVNAYMAVDPFAHLTPIVVEHHVSLWVGRVGGTWALVDQPSDWQHREMLARTGRWREFYAMGAPWLTTFRADLMAKLPDGRIVVIDHKTGYKSDEAKRAGFRASGQMIQFQLWGALGYQAKFGGVHVGFVNLRDTAQWMPGMAMRKAAAAFSSFAVVSAPAQIMDFPRQVAMRAEMMARLMAVEPDADQWPRALREQGPCTDRYGSCDYFASCVGG